MDQCKLLIALGVGLLIGSIVSNKIKNNVQPNNDCGCSR